MAYVRVRHEDATVKALQNTITAGFYQKNRSLVTVWDLPNMIVSAVGWAQSFSSNPLPKYLNEVKKAMVKFQEEIRWILSLVSGIRNSKNVEIIGQARDPEGTRSVEAVDPRPYISFGTAVAVNEPAPPVDAAMNAAVKAPGGIDLNPANLNLRIKRDGKGVPLPIGRQDMGDLGRIEGLVPVIIKIVPATYIPALSDVLAAVD